MSSEAMKLAADLCNKAIKGGQVTSKGVVVLGTVQGDIHDIGKSIVGSFLAASGFTIHDLGRDVSAEAFVDKATEVNADVIATSALLTTTMKAQANLEDILTEESLKGKIKTMVGGVPVNQAWADNIGADGYAEDAAGAARKIKELIGR
jgi:dimethylamine corrinoid protein